MARFEEERIHDFKLALQAFVDGMIDRQKTVNGFIRIEGVYQHSHESFHV
jgi:hypothetical protein